MPKAPPRKPSGVKESFALPKGALQCGAGALFIASVIGLSHVLSPVDAQPATPASPAVKHVKTLDDATLDNFLASHPEGALVDFYSNDCSFCKKLAPEFEAAAKELSSSGGPPLASVDSESGAKMMQRFGIQRFPTVLWFWRGENVLELPRAAEKPAAKIVEWARWAITPAVQELETQAEFNEALATLRSSLHKSARLMVAFNGEASGQDANKHMRAALEAAAQRHRATTVFLYIKEASPGQQPVLRSYGQEESNDEEYTGATDATEVIQWVKGALEKAKPPADAESKTATDKAMEQVQQNAETAQE